MATEISDWFQRGRGLRSKLNLVPFAARAAAIAYSGGSRPPLRGLSSAGWCARRRSRDRFAGDSPLEERVSSEPVSVNVAEVVRSGRFWTASGTVKSYFWAPNFTRINPLGLAAEGPFYL
jgi:hypothetical protein